MFIASIAPVHGEELAEGALLRIFTQGGQERVADRGGSEGLRGVGVGSGLTALLRQHLQKEGRIRWHRRGPERGVGHGRRSKEGAVLLLLLLLVAHEEGSQAVAGGRGG